MADKYPRKSNALRLLKGKVIVDRPSPIMNITAVDKDRRVIFFRDGTKMPITRQRLKTIIDKRLTHEVKIKEMRERMRGEHKGGSIFGMRHAAEMSVRSSVSPSISNFNRGRVRSSRNPHYYS